GEGQARWAVEGTTLGWRGHRYRVTPRSFIQVNQAQMDVLYQCVLDGLGDITGTRVVDAYAGIGVLSVELAARVGAGGAVVCVEEVPAAARLGLLNAQLNGVEGVMRYDARRVEVALPELAVAGSIDALVVDPPRAGCAGSVTGWLALRGPRRVAYVSCDPATLARDLHILVASGPYVVERLDLVDMFPQTHHIECVALLRRQCSR
ncbi:MAG TPA: class I SAM-dependent RNA methyltransferase, partial [Candidatus Dormibacteraeota bacterium]